MDIDMECERLVLRALKHQHVTFGAIDDFAAASIDAYITDDIRRAMRRLKRRGIIEHDQASRGWVLVGPRKWRGGEV